MSFAKERALKWVEGVIVGYVKGTIELNRALGMINKALESYGVTREELFTIIKNVEQNPVYLPFIKTEEKVFRLKSLKDKIA